MRFHRLTSVRFALAGFLTVMGALLFVAPHQFEDPEYSLLLNSTDSWGAVFILLGLLIFGLSMFRFPRLLEMVIYGSAAAVFLVLSVDFLYTDFWIWALNYFILALLALALLLISRSAPQGESLDFLALFASLLSISSGLLFLFTRGGFSDARYDGIRPYLGWVGGMFLVAGAVLLLSRRLARNRPWIKTAAYSLAGAVFLLYCWLVPVNHGLWPGILFYGWVGLLLLVLPHIRPRVRALNPALLQTRLSILLAITMAAPLISTVALISKMEERSVTNDALASQRNESAMLAETTTQYILLHRSALHMLATQEDLPNRKREELARLLRQYASTYPDVIAFSIFDASGQPVARSDEVEAVPLTGTTVFSDLINSLQPGARVYFSPIYDRPILAFSEPLFDAGGAFRGMVMISIDSNQVSAFLGQRASESEQIAYMVDANGQVIAHPDASLVAGSTNLSAREPVNLLLDSTQTRGSFIYGPAYNRSLVGFAHVSELGWSVVLERPLAAALASVHSGRDLAFGILLVFLIILSAVGAFIARWVSGPLQKLDEAATALAAGNNRVPLPTSRITEIERLANSFQLMREKLQQRTAERERAEKALIEANAQLEERVAQRTADLQATTQALTRSNRELQDFAYITSHDLQEPLRKIQAFGDRLRNQTVGSLSPESEDSLARMQNAALRMQKMVDDLLTYSRVTTKAQPPARVSLEPVIREVIADLEFRIEETGGQVLVETLPELYIDPSHMRQLFQNLLGNALKFHRPGVPPIVRIYCMSADDRHVNLVVEDNGIGFEPQYAERIFQPFQRLHSRDAYEGNGIGLSICRKILETNGGTIRAESIYGQSTRFILTFPLVSQGSQEGVAHG